MNKTVSKREPGGASDPDILREWADLLARGQHAVDAFARAQADLDEYRLIDPPAVARAFADLSLRLAADPARLAEAQIALWQGGLRLWQYWADRLLDRAPEPVAEPDPGDRRFADKAWRDQLVFDYMKQSYLLTARWLRGLVASVDDELDPHAQQVAEFYTRQFVSALAPSNFVATNPVVLRQTAETKGHNLVDGLKHLLDDLEAGRGRLKITMTDPKAFRVGENVAATPGKVIFQNELMQLIQYAPSSETVHRRPLLFVPPWINKFYVMDLQPRNSLIKWVVDQGHTLFVISWANPGPELAHKSFADYMLEGPLAALGAIERATGESEVNLLGFCIGGILGMATLAWLGAKGDRRVVSGTFLATLVDFRDVGEVSVFIDERQVQSMERHVAKRGYLEAHHLAEMFSMMRENDLIWSFVVSNYLMGREPIPFDLLYWNADSTRLPARMLIEYLHRFYLENGLIRPGQIVLDGVPIHIGNISVPIYFLATKEDHIAPWMSCYPVTRHATGAKVRFVLGGSGHIAGVINPPAAQKYCYWTNTRAPADAMEWFAGARQHAGSWWPGWGRWLARLGGQRVPAREPGAGGLAAIEDAPGSYVRVRAQG